MMDYRKSIYQDIGEAHYLYNQIRWTITQIGWWYYKVEKPKTFADKWKMFGLWMDSQYTGHKNYMNTGEILKNVVKDDYISKLYQHIVKMRGLFTHFFCDVELYGVMHKAEYETVQEIEELPIISCGKSELPEEVNKIFLFTFNYYCLKLYNKIAGFITNNMDKNYDTFRYDLSLRRGNIFRQLHYRWDFDVIYGYKDKKE